MTDEEMFAKLEAILLEDEEHQMNFPAIPAGSSPPELLSSDAVFPSSPRGNFVEQTPFRDAETLQDVVESTKTGISNLSYPVTYGSAGIADELVHILIYSKKAPEDFLANPPTLR
jgi:hypothetical protein